MIFKLDNLLENNKCLSAVSRPPPSLSGNATNSDAGDELSEDDVFFAGDFSNPPSTSSTPPLHPINHNNHKSFKQEGSGILAALPESGKDRSNRSVFNQKPSLVSSQPPSSSMTIPSGRRPGGMSDMRTSSMPVKYKQSALMKVPLMQAREKRRREGSAFGYDDCDTDDDDEGEMLPHHEIVARKRAMSPMLSCSVLEGAGRKLKGRDLRQVRTAVFRQTGIKVLVKCDRVKNLSVATTDGTGVFETNLPSNAPTSAAPTSENCLARLYGGPNHIFALKKDMVAKIVPAQGAIKTYTLPTPLAFTKSCPGKCDLGVLSSKTIGIPIPPGYACPPSDLFTHMLPIIGIP